MNLCLDGFCKTCDFLLAFCNKLIYYLLHNLLRFTLNNAKRKEIIMFTKKEVETIVTEARKALQEVGDKYGVRFQQQGSVKFDENKAWFTTEMQKSDLIQNTGFFHIDCINRQFALNGAMYTVIQFKTRSKKSPVVFVNNENGKKYVASIDQAKKWLNMEQTV